MLSDAVKMILFRLIQIWDKMEHSSKKEFRPRKNWIMLWKKIREQEWGRLKWEDEHAFIYLQVDDNFNTVNSSSSRVQFLGSQGFTTKQFTLGDIWWLLSDVPIQTAFTFASRHGWSIRNGIIIKHISSSHLVREIPTPRQSAPRRFPPSEIGFRSALRAHEPRQLLEPIARQFLYRSIAVCVD